jgi:uncharacterized PurR-regulated membrane protein YhhQ (DUF165 family)
MGAILLFIEALAACCGLLAAHSLRHRVGNAPFFALLGGLTAIMAWVTDAGLRAEMAGITFMTGSTVFYTALLTGVFVVYVFDGPGPARIAILTVVGVSTLTPALSALLHLQQEFMVPGGITAIPESGLRINAASVVTTLADLVFLGVAWEFLGRPTLRIPLALRTFLTLLGVFWLDVLLFSTLAFYGQSGWLSILQGTLLNRLIVALIIFPVLYAYLHWQSGKPGIKLENRPLLSVLLQVEEISTELKTAREEIDRRKAAEAECDRLIAQLKQTLNEVKTLRGFIPICSHCKKIRDDDGYWTRLEEYLSARSGAEFTHGICPDCLKKQYPDFDPTKLKDEEV